MSGFVTVKIHLKRNGETRKFKMVKNQINFKVLVQKIYRLFEISEEYDLILKYEDLDGDTVSFSTDEELFVALDEFGCHRKFTVYAEEILSYGDYYD